ncbi:unnamed protein product [Moneuplotes crassus]|uniref:Uncharacterized protein n=1 Tax=Euplotes crassus TaxID=5936 RepID=A0AAD1Y8Y9_EUPCR|nr:unnamed protein product [Moneuplotes crassus]
MKMNLIINRIKKPLSSSKQMQRRILNSFESEVLSKPSGRNTGTLVSKIEQTLSDMIMIIYRNRCFQDSYIEIFFMLFTKTMILESIRFKKKHLYRSALTALDSVQPLTPKFLNSKKPDTIHYLTKMYLIYQSLHFSLQEYDKALSFGRKGLEMASKELSLRFKKKREDGYNNKAKMYKVQRMFETIALLFYDMSFIFEGLKDFHRMETCLINGRWFADHFLKDKNDIKKSICFILKMCQDKYSSNIIVEKQKKRLEKKNHDGTEIKNFSRAASLRKSISNESKNEYYPRSKGPQKGREPSKFFMNSLKAVSSSSTNFSPKQRPKSARFGKVAKDSDKTIKLMHIFQENRMNESGNELIKSMMNNSLYSIGAITHNFENASRNTKFKPSKFAHTEVSAHLMMARKSSVFSDKSPKAPKRSNSKPISKKTNVLIPPDVLIRSKICETLKIDEKQLTTSRIKVGVESQEASKKFMRYAHKYHKELAFLKDDLRQRKKESMLEHYNPALKRVLSQPATKINPAGYTKERRTENNSTSARATHKEHLKLSKEIKQCSLYHKKKAEYDLLVKKRKNMLKEMDKTRKAKKAKLINMAKIKKNPVRDVKFNQIYNQVIEQYPTLEKNYLDGKKEEVERRKMISKADDIKKTKNDEFHEMIMDLQKEIAFMQPSGHTSRLKTLHSYKKKRFTSKSP